MIDFGENWPNDRFKKIEAESPNGETFLFVGGRSLFTLGKDYCRWLGREAAIVRFEKAEAVGAGFKKNATDDILKNLECFECFFRTKIPEKYLDKVIDCFLGPTYLQFHLVDNGETDKKKTLAIRQEGERFQFVERPSKRLFRQCLTQLLLTGKIRVDKDLNRGGR